MSNNISGHKIMAHLDRVVGDHRPITADIFLTNRCNNNCPYCTYKRWELDLNANHMTFQQFVKYSARLQSLGVLGFILTGGGEPTLAPDFHKITQWMTEHNMRWGINTNLNRFVKIKPDYLKVSLDGYDEDSYEKARGVRMYEKVRENIQEYAKWKKEHSPKTSLGIQAVAENREEVERFYEANQDLDVDYIVIRPIESTGGGYYRDKKNLSEILETIDALMKLDYRVVKNFKWDLLNQKEKSCTAQWAQIAVNEKGEVMYCCHKPFEIVGHVMDPEILTLKEMAVTDMKKCDVPCRMTAPNMFVSQLNQDWKDDCFI